MLIGILERHVYVGVDGGDGAGDEGGGVVAWYGRWGGVEEKLLNKYWYVTLQFIA